MLYVYYRDKLYFLNVLQTSDPTYRYFKDNDLYGDSLEEDSQETGFHNGSPDYQDNQTDVHPLSILIPDDPQRIFYNRVPKSGSTTTRSLFNTLSYKRQFTFYSSKQSRTYMLNGLQVCGGVGGVGRPCGVAVVGCKNVEMRGV